MAELRVLDDLDATEIDAPANFGGGASDDHDRLVERRRRLDLGDHAAEERGGSEREELLGLAEAGRRAGREDESGDERPHPPRPARCRAGSRSNVSLQERQQKYTCCPDTSERYSALPTSTNIPQIGSLTSVTRAAAWRCSVSGQASFSLRWCWMISARMLTAISSGVTAPMSSPAGAFRRARCSGGTPRCFRRSRITAARRRLPTPLTQPAPVPRTR